MMPASQERRAPPCGQRHDNRDQPVGDQDPRAKGVPGRCHRQGRKHDERGRSRLSPARGKADLAVLRLPAGASDGLAWAGQTRDATEVLGMKLPGLFLNAKTFQEVPAGTLIFEAGASGTAMFGIVEGEVQVRLPNGAVRRLGPGETFGEMAIVDSSPRSATVVAVTDTRLAVIDRRTFLFLVHETPMFALQVMSSMAERLRAEPR